MRARYQSGNITLKTRKGPNVWEFRWYEPDGPVPLAAELIRVLQEWRRQTPYAADSDWVFASSYNGGGTSLLA
jgi:hypothetical protein